MEGGNTKGVFIWLVICALVIQIVPVNITGDSWTQTTQEDFEGGETWNTNVTLSPGDVTLDLNPDWWNSSWKYRIPINITENSGDDLTDFQVPIEVDTKALIDAGKMRSDLGDIRFTDPSGQELPYWVEVIGNLSNNLTNDSIAYWNFDEGSGQDAYDLSGNGNDGQLGSTSGVDIDDPTWIDGISETALKFDGVDDIVNIQDTSILRPTHLTLSAWIKIDDAEWPDRIITKNNQYSQDPYDSYAFAIHNIVGQQYNITFHLGIGSTSVNLPSPTWLDFNKWYFVVGTYDENVAKIYINGDLDGEKYFSGPISYNGEPLTFGGQNIQAFFNGTLDEVRIYDRVLGAEEINALYQGKTRIWLNVSPLPASQITTIYMYYGNPYVKSASNFDATFTKDYGEEGLMGLWHMDEGSGLMTNDSSGNGNNGTLINGPVWQNEDGGQWDGRSDVKFLNGSALEFDGLDDYIDIGNLGCNHSMGTIMAWINFIGGSEYMIFSISDGKSTTDDWLQFYFNNGELRTQLAVGGVWQTHYTGSILNDENWHHVVVTQNNNNLSMYVDGILKLTVGNTIWLDDMNDLNYYRIANTRHNDVEQCYFPGLIDEVRIYNRSLNVDEIKAHYERRKYTSPEPTVKIGLEEGRYKPSGTFTSSVFDSLANGTLWNSISWIQTLPPGTNITIATRSGDVIIPGPTWSLWSGELFNELGSSIPSPRSRYIQYRATLTTTNTSATPVLHEVVLDYTLNSATSPIPILPPDGNWTTNNTPTFSWTYSDPNLDSQIQFEIQIDDESSFLSIDYASGPISSSNEFWDSVMPIADGSWYWRVRTMDEYGLWSDWSFPRVINIDTTPPTQPTDVTAEPDTWTNVNSFTVNWTNPSDFSAVKPGAWYKIGSPPTSNSDGTWSNTKPLTVPSYEGQQSIYIWLEDNLGNVDFKNNATAVLYLDTTPPQSPINLIAIPDSWTGLNSFLINWTDPTDDSGVKLGAWYKIGAPPTTITDGIWNDTRPFSVTSFEGSQPIFIWLEDNVGNVDYMSNATVLLYLDTTPPEPFTPTADPSNWTSNDQPQITFSTTDSGTGMSHYEVQIDSGSFTTQISPYTLPPQTDGIHTVTIRAFDNVGNYREGSVEVYIDTTPPEAFTPIADPSGWASNNQPQINFSTTDITSGISHYEVFTSLEPPIGMWSFNEGSGQVAYDLSGNGNDGQLGSTSGVDIDDPSWVDGISEKALKYDGVDDVVTIQDTSILRPTHLTLSAWIKIDDAEWPDRIITKNNQYSQDPYDSYAFAIHNIVGQQYNITFHLGIGSTSVNLPSPTWLDFNKWYFVVGTYDENVAKIYINGDLDGEKYFSGPISYNGEPLTFGGQNTQAFFNGTLDEVGIYDRALSAEEIKAYYEQNLTIGSFVAQSSPYTLPSQTDGTHTITIRAYDNAGNYREGTVEVYIDTSPPLVPSNIGATPDSWTKSNSFSINWTNPTETDTSGIKIGAWYKIGSPPTYNSDGTWIGEKPFTVTSLEGDQILYVWLEDNLGNVDYNNYGTTTLYLDTTPPGPPTNVTASPSSWTMSNSFNIDWVNPSDDSGVKTGAYYKIGSPPNSDSDGTWVGQKPITVTTTEGVTVIYIWLEDNLENRDYQNYGFTNLYLDSITPIINHTPVTHAKKGEAITITATVTDNVGVKTVTLHYKKQDDEAFEQVTMVKDGDVYSADIPSSFVTKQNIEYYISASDEINTATYPSSDATTSYLPIDIDDEDELFVPSWLWLILVFLIIIVFLALFLSRRRGEKEPGAIAEEEPQPEVYEELPEEESEIAALEEEREVGIETEEEPGLPEEESEIAEREEEAGTPLAPTQDAIPPPTQDLSDDEIFKIIKEKYEEGKISEETFQDFKKRYGKE